MAVKSKIQIFVGRKATHTDLSQAGNGLNLNELQIGGVNLASTTDTAAGADKVGAENKTYSNISGLTTHTVQDFIDRIDAALGAAGVSLFDEADFAVHKTGSTGLTAKFVLTALTAARTITMPDTNVDLGDIATNTAASSANTSDIADLRTTQGTSDGDTDLGTFTGSTIADASSVKTALQALETKAEQNTTDIGTNDTDISNLQGALGASTEAGITYSSTNYVTNGSDVVTAAGALDAQVKLNTDNIASLTQAQIFKGGFDASTLGSQLDNAESGNYWIVTVSGTIFGTNPLTVNAGDHLVATADVTGTPDDGAAWSKVDNTESADILRTGDLADTQIYIGNSGATATTVSGDVTIDAAGVTTLGNDKVTTAKILDANVTTAKIADDNVTTSKIATAAINSDKLGTGSVTTSKLADDGVTVDKIADAAVTTAKLANDSVDKDKINADVAGSGMAQKTDGSLVVRGTIVELTNNSGSTIPAGSFVRISAAGEMALAQADVYSTASAGIGVTLASVANAATGEVQLSGTVTVLPVDSAGSATTLAVGPVHLSVGVAGAVSQAETGGEALVSGGAILEVGKMIGSTTMLLDVKQAIEVE